MCWELLLKNEVASPPQAVYYKSRLTVEFHRFAGHQIHPLFLDLLSLMPGSIFAEPEYSLEKLLCILRPNGRLLFFLILQQLQTRLWIGLEEFGMNSSY